jgi:hypothetical protein
MNDATAPQQQQDDDDAKPFDPAAEEMDGMTGMTNAPHQNHQSYDTSEMDRTPVHMKDDGWVNPSLINLQQQSISVRAIYNDSQVAVPIILGPRLHWNYDAAMNIRNVCAGYRRGLHQIYPMWWKMVEE